MKYLFKWVIYKDKAIAHRSSLGTEEELSSVDSNSDDSIAVVIANDGDKCKAFTPNSRESVTTIDASY